MTKLDIDDLKSIASSMLFENSINELRLPLDHDMDMFKNNSTSAKNQAVPQIDGQGNYKNSWEEEKPIASSELVNNQSLIRVDVNTGNVHSKDIMPQNVVELSSLIQVALKDLGQNDLTQKEISLIWKTIAKVIENK